MRAPPAEPFLRILTRDIFARSHSDERLDPFARKLAGVDTSAVRYHGADPLEHPTMRFRDPVLRSAAGAPDLVAATRAAAQALRWYQIFQGDGADGPLAEGLLAAQAAGNVGMIPSDDLRCGMFLLAPGVHYPPHTHGASEIYYCMSGAVELAYGLGGGSFLLHPGSVCVTPPHRLHSLTTHDAPVLLLYVWLGDLDAPNWWWQEDTDGTWTRTKWIRSPDASWRRERSEPVTRGIMDEALGRGAPGG